MSKNRILNRVFEVTCIASYQHVDNFRYGWEFYDIMQNAYQGVMQDIIELQGVKPILYKDYEQVKK